MTHRQTVVEGRKSPGIPVPCAAENARATDTPKNYRDHEELLEGQLASQPVEPVIPWKDTYGTGIDVGKYAGKNHLHPQDKEKSHDQQRMHVEDRIADMDHAAGKDRLAGHSGKDQQGAGNGEEPVGGCRSIKRKCRHPSRQRLRWGGLLRPSLWRVMGTSAIFRPASLDLMTISDAHSIPVVTRPNPRTFSLRKARRPQ